MFNSVLDDLVLVCLGKPVYPGTAFCAVAAILAKSLTYLSCCMCLLDCVAVNTLALKEVSLMFSASPISHLSFAQM